jgi:hypothetical protein
LIFEKEKDVDTMVRAPPKSRPFTTPCTTPQRKTTSRTRKETPSTSSSQPSPEPTGKRQKLIYDNSRSPSDEPESLPISSVKIGQRNNNSVIHGGERWGSSPAVASEHSSEEGMDDVYSLREEAMTAKPINKKKYPSLQEAEIHALSHYIRRTLFRKLKFLNHAIMQDLLKEIHLKLEITDPEKQREKITDLIKCTKDTLTSRRGYTSQIIVNKLRGKTL